MVQIPDCIVFEGTGTMYLVDGTCCGIVFEANERAAWISVIDNALLKQPPQ